MENINKAFELLGFETYKSAVTTFFFDKKTGSNIPVEAFVPEDYFSRMVDSLSKKQLEAFDKALLDDRGLEKSMDSLNSPAEMLGFICSNKKKFTEILLKSL